MSEPRLIAKTSSCISCGKSRALASKTDPILVSLTPVFYRQGAGVRRVYSGQRVIICEDCLEAAFISVGCYPSQTLWRAMLSSIQPRYEEVRKG
jgi:hypothetical protein